jgi:hypothetical protein
MQVQTLDIEMQRRNFWSWYIMHCHSDESAGVLEAAGDIANLPLPWSEEDFAATVTKSAACFLSSRDGTNSIFAELAKLFTIW